jgi:hypothetical protein
MRRHMLWNAVVLATVAWFTGAAWGANTLEIESKTVNKGQTGVTVAIKLTNDVAIRNIVLPLALRSVTPGAFVTALQPVYGDRLPTTPGAPIVDIKIRNQYAEEDGNCKASQPGGFGTIAFSDGASHPVVSSPEAVLFVRGKIFGAALPPGADVTGSMGLVVDVTLNQGMFEIDTTCANPANHYLLVQDVTNTQILPALTTGLITIGHPPVARDTSWTTAEDTPRNVTYLPASDPDSDPLTFSINAGPEHGSISGFNAATGAFLYTPAPNFHGSDSLEFQATDGGFFSNVSKVRITVSSVNDAPVARDTLVETNEDTPVNAQFQAYDADLDPLTYTKLTGPFHGTFTGFSLSTGSFTYTPAPDYFGPDSITFRARDAVLNSNNATVRISVLAVNDPPVARDSALSTGKNTSVLGRFQSYDVDGGPPAYARLDGPFNGTLTGFDASTGVFTYTPNLDFLGRDSIKFHVFDGVTNSNIGTVRIVVEEAICHCPYEGDPNLDGSPDVLDVVHEIDVVFEEGPYLVIRPCRLPYEDMNCDCVLDVFDIIYLIDFVFDGGPNPCKLCETVCP